MQRTVLVNGTFLVGDELRPVTGGLAISDGLVESWGADVRPGPGDEVVDLDGGTAMPGLLDAHCHLIYRDVADPYDIELRKSVPQATVDAVYNANVLLRKGFTTVRDVGSRANIGVEVREAIRRGDVPGPRVLAAGRIVSAPGGTAPPTGTVWPSRSSGRTRRPPWSAPSSRTASTGSRSGSAAPGSTHCAPPSAAA